MNKHTLELHSKQYQTYFTKYCTTSCFKWRTVSFNNHAAVIWIKAKRPNKSTFLLQHSKYQRLYKHVCNHQQQWLNFSQQTKQQIVYNFAFQGLFPSDKVTPLLFTKIKPAVAKKLGVKKTRIHNPEMHVQHHNFRETRHHEKWE